MIDDIKIWDAFMKIYEGGSLKTLNATRIGTFMLELDDSDILVKYDIPDNSDLCLNILRCNPPFTLKLMFINISIANNISYEKVIDTKRSVSDFFEVIKTIDFPRFPYSIHYMDVERKKEELRRQHNNNTTNNTSNITNNNTNNNTTEGLRNLFDRFNKTLK